MTEKYSNKGFTLPDVILVIAIIAVLITSLYPTISSYLTKSMEQEEYNTQQMIADSFEVYLESVGEFPTAPATANILAAANFNDAWTRVGTVFSSDTVVTNLSVTDMRDDEFGQTRLLLTDTQTVNFAGGTYDVYYIAIVSLGDDGCFGVEANPAPPCDNATPASLAAVDGTAGFSLNDYDLLVENPLSDDIITKFTDAALKTEHYNDLLLQISSVDQALDQFAYQARKRAETLVENGCQALVNLTYSIFNCYEDIRANVAPGNGVANQMPDTQIFVPPSTGETLTDYDVSFTGSRYVVDAVTTATAQTGTTRSTIYNVDNPGSQTVIRNRKEAMVALMSILGLPSRYCCNPLDKYFDQTTRKWEDTPLFYQSNPRRISVAP